MKASAFFPAVLLAAGLVLGVAGCAQQPTIASSHVSSGARSARTFALSVTLPDGSPITAQQWATVKAAFEQQLAAAGYRLTDDISQAERIIRVVFSPSFEDPTLGTSTVLSVRSNPMYAYNGGGYGRPAFAYGFAGYPYGDPFYGNSRYDYSYTYVSNPTTVTPRCDPPGTSRSRPGNDADCSPGASRGDGGQYAHHGGNGGNWGSNHGPGPSGDSGRSWNGGSSSYSRSSDSYSSPSSSYSSSSSLPSASFSSGSSSYSSSSYSGPSSSYSSSSSSSMPSASFSSGSSSSSSSGSGGSSSTTSNQNAN